MKFIIIIPVTLKPQAEAFARQIDPLSLGEDFTTPLRLIGTSETTHFVSMPNVTDDLVIAAIRGLGTSPAFVEAGGVFRECNAVHARSTFLSVLSELGLEEIPPPAE